MSVTAQQHAEIVERRDNTGQFNAINQKDRQRDFLLTYRIQKEILQILRSFSHFFIPLFRSATNTDLDETSTRKIFPALRFYHPPQILHLYIDTESIVAGIIPHSAKG
jgi:hypothetical protein